MKDNINKATLPAELEALCETTGTRKEGIAALMKYYMETCGWTETVAIEHMVIIFQNVIQVDDDAAMALRKILRKVVFQKTGKRDG